MKDKKKILLVISVLMIIIPFFINVYSIYKLISVCIGITLLDVFFATIKKPKLIMLFYLPILLLIITYSIDYVKTYSFKLIPIYAFENKINKDIAIYNSLLYRVYKCDNEYVFDNNYEKNFSCDTELIKEININKLLNEPKKSYKEYKNKFVKVTGKVSKIIGSNSLEMQEYSEVAGELNGYVKFNETSKLIVKLKGIDVSNFKIYDYITVVGLINEYDSDNLIMTDVKIEERNLYDKYELHVIEGETCDKTLKEYIDNYYLLCLENIYLDYKVDKYELSYALKDKKITIDKLLNEFEEVIEDEYKVYKYSKFNILSCNENKNIIMNKNVNIDYSLCKEE